MGGDVEGYSVIVTAYGWRLRWDRDTSLQKLQHIIIIIWVGYPGVQIITFLFYNHFTEWIIPELGL